MAPFGLAGLVFAFTPTSIGYQDLASLLAQQPGVSERWRQQIASPFGTIHAATFSVPRPIGTSIPDVPHVRLASLNASDVIVTGSIGQQALTVPDTPGVVFPTVNRAAKGDFLRSLQELPSALDERPSKDLTPPNEATPNSEEDEELEAAIRFKPFPEYDISLSLEAHPQVPVDTTLDFPGSDADQPDISLLTMANDPDPSKRTKRLFFGASPMGSSSAGIVPWKGGEQPIVMLPRAPTNADVKQLAVAALPDRSDIDVKGGAIGQTVAPKGVVGQQKSPAERLGLVAQAREKAEKCLANAVYFEARGEAVRGQIAVAQVVINRAFSGYYPSDICGVVYQNAHKHLACQFTFACDGIPDVVTETEPWERAKKISRAMLDGRIWLPEIGKATHYHANWVNPWWVRTMRVVQRIGVHTFYRPQRWGNGADAPSWGTTSAITEAAAAKL